MDFCTCLFNSRSLLVGRLIVPQNAPFKKAQHAWVPPVNGDIQELKQIYESALGHLPC